MTNLVLSESVWKRSNARDVRNIQAITIHITWKEKKGGISLLVEMPLHSSFSQIPPHTLSSQLGRVVAWKSGLGIQVHKSRLTIPGYKPRLANPGALPKEVRSGSWPEQQHICVLSTDCCCCCCCCHPYAVMTKFDGGEEGYAEPVEPWRGRHTRRSMHDQRRKTMSLCLFQIVLLFDKTTQLYTYIRLMPAHCTYL